MANVESIKATIDANIKPNGNNAITGGILNQVLNEMADGIGENANTNTSNKNDIAELKAKDAQTDAKLTELSAEVGEVSAEVKSKLGTTYSLANANTYLHIFPDVVLTAGSIIENKGDIKVLLAEQQSGFVGRIDLKPNEKITLVNDITYIQTLDKGGYVELEVYSKYVDFQSLKDFQFTTDNILDKAVTPEKASFMYSVNLFNLNDINVALGTYVTKTGLVENSSYNTTGYIPVKEGTQYQLLSTEASAYNLNARFVLFYNANREPIGDLITNAKDVNAPNGAVWLRASYQASLWGAGYFQVSEGSSPIPFQPFQLAIGKEYLPSIDSSYFDGNNFFLPKDIYVASGRTIELYYSQILLNYHKYNIKAQCSIGAALERKFQIKGDDAHIGNYPLTIFVYDDNGKILKSASSTIHIIDASVSNMAILPIGDSLTNAKAWLQEVYSLSANAVTFVGTRKTGYADNPSIRHEGRSGGTCSMYNTDSVPYTYADNGYDGVGANAATFDSSKSYAVGDFCKYGDAVYVFTSAHSGAWNASHARNLSQSNPFWDWTNNKFSINHYKSFYGINYNAIMIFLGTNGLSLEPETNENGALGIKTIVENIRKEDTTTPIIVVNTIYRSGQNGIGTQGNTDGYKAQSEFKFEADKKVMLLAKAIEDMIGSMANVYMCPVGFTHDSEYNFGNVKKEVNPRLTDTSEVFERFPLDSVHPQLEGYLQMADEMFSTICAL